MAIVSYQPQVIKKIITAPVQRILLIVALTFAIEVLLMLLIHTFVDEANYMTGLMHGTLFISLQLPFIYFLLIKPMLNHINEFKKAQLSLVESERHFRSLADAGEALIWTTGPDGVCNYVNQPWLTFTGRNFEEELDNGWAQGIHPDDRQNCFEAFKIAFDNHEKFIMKYRMRHANGHYHWIQDNGTPCFNSKGEFTGYIGHCLDINDLVYAQEQLREKEKNYRAIFEFLPITALYYDVKGTILFWNKAAERTFGWTKEEVIGKNITQFFKPDYDRPEINYDIEQSLSALGHSPLIKENKRKDGSFIICEWQRTIFYDSDGKIRTLNPI